MHPRPHELALLAAALLAGALLGGCRVSRPNPEHCFHASGDQTCAELDPAMPYCSSCTDDPYGCVAEPPADECYSPCGQDSSIADDASCIEVGDESTDTATETDTETDTDPLECFAHEDCPEDAPYCKQGTCVPCDQTVEPDEACFTLSQGQATICLDGECVECSEDQLEPCIDDLLACDLQSHTCVACTGHDQCPGQAGCDLLVGECLPADAVWHVDGDGGQDFETIAEALAAIGSGSGTIVVHELDTPGYAEGIAVTGDRALAVFGAEGELPTLYMTPVALDVSDGARVYARRMSLRGEDAALVTGSHVELDAVILAPQFMHPLRLEDSTLRMRNSMVRTTFDPTYPAIEIVGTGDVEIRYSTLAGLSDQAAVSCQGASLAPGSRIRNSMIVNLGDTESAIACAGLSYAHNGLEDATGFVDNTTIGDATIDWFANPLYGDMHLSIVAPVAAATAAVWAEGDPLADFDGDPRPATEGSPDFVGADRLP